MENKLDIYRFVKNGIYCIDSTVCITNQTSQQPPSGIAGEEADEQTVNNRKYQRRIKQTFHKLFEIENDSKLKLRKLIIAFEIVGNIIDNVF